MSTRMLTFELVISGDKIEVHGNSEGLLHLAEILTDLAKMKKPDHVHLMTPDWGGNSLSNEAQGLSNTIFNHVEIFVWP